MDELTPVERDMLAFERRRWLHAGAREEAIKVEFGLSVHRYEQMKNALIDRPVALVHDPQLVNRLRRLRQTRRARRAG